MRVIIRNVSSKISSKKEHIALNKMLNYLNGYKRECVLAPLFKMLEASFDLFVPLVMADIVNVGIAAHDFHYILMRCGILLLLAIIGLACGAGYVECAAFATLVVLVVELVLIRLEFKLTSKNTDLTLYIEYAHAVCMESVLALLRERRVQIESLEISRIADTDAPDAPHHYCALIPIHSRAPLRPGDLRNDLAALPDILTVEEM